MEITVNYLTKIKKLIGKSYEKLDIKNSQTVESFIINTLCKKHENLSNYIITSDGSLCKAVAVFMKDEKINPSQVILRNNSEITIFSPIAGG